MTSDRGKQLAMLLQAIADTEMEFAEQKTEFKDRMTRLHNEADKLRRDILSGQMSLTDVASKSNGKEKSELPENGAGE